MRSEALRDLSIEEARIRLRDDIAELENMRFQQTLQELEHSHRIREVRRDIARLRTVLREFELGIRIPPDKTETSQENSGEMSQS